MVYYNLFISYVIMGNITLRDWSESITANNTCLFSLIPVIDVKLNFLCVWHSKTHEVTMPIKYIKKWIYILNIQNLCLSLRVSDCVIYKPIGKNKEKKIDDTE